MLWTSFNTCNSFKEIFQWTESIKWWKSDSLIKIYDQLHLLVIDETLKEFM